MLRFGTISTIDAAKGLAKVLFGDDGVVSGWIPLSFRGTKYAKEAWAPEVNEHVAVLVDDTSTAGVIVGAIYSELDLPTITNPDQRGIDMGDGSLDIYDYGDRLFSRSSETTELKQSPDGHSIKRGAETLLSILSDLIDAMEAETHTTPTGVSGPPLNVAQYQAIKTRLLGLFFE